MKCTLKKEGLVTIFDVDGKSIYPSAYMTYCPDKKYFDEFRENDIKIFMFPIYFGDEGINFECGLHPFADNIFKGYGEYDFAPVEKVMNMISPKGDEEVYIIPRVCLEPPIWWQRANPDECAEDSAGQKLRECFTSEKWREDMTVVLKALIDYFNSSKWADKVIGYHIAGGGTEEWTYQSRYFEEFYDYSEKNLIAYRKFLSQRYGDITALNKAHNENYSSFEDIIFPTPVERLYAKNYILRNEKEEKGVLDYFDFHNDAVAETILYFCKAVKEYTDGERLTGVFYGYVVTMPHNFKGLHALGKVLKSPYVDFVSTTNSEVQAGEGWNFASAVHSALLNGKAWLSEGDIRTSKTTLMKDTMPECPPDNPYYETPVWQPLPEMKDSLSVLTKGLARILTAPCGIWWFDMFSGWFSAPEMMNIISKCAPLIKEQQNDYLKAEVALIIDEGGHKYFGGADKLVPPATWAFIRNLSHAGVPYHIYLQSDIVNDNFPADDYKLYIFQSSVEPTPDEKAAINKKLKCGNKTLLWLYCSSAFDKELGGFALLNTGKHSTAVFRNEEYGSTEIPLLSFDNPEGYVLSRHKDSGEPACVWQKHKDYNTVHSVHLDISAKLIAHIALLAGVHLYNLDGDIIFAGGNFVGIHTVGAGYRRIALPKPEYKAFDALSGEEIPVNDVFIDMKLDKHETKLIKITKE